jgi:hypothetical protein
VITMMIMTMMMMFTIMMMMVIIHSLTWQEIKFCIDSHSSLNTAKQESVILSPKLNYVFCILNSKFLIYIKWIVYSIKHTGFFLYKTSCCLSGCPDVCLFPIIADSGLLGETFSIDRYIFIHGLTAIVGLACCVFPRSPSDTPHSVGLLWTSDQLVA